MVRQQYKPKISKRKIKEMQALVEKTTANKPNRDLDGSVSSKRYAQSPKRLKEVRKSAPYGNDYFNDVRGGTQDSEDEFVKLEELGFGRAQEYSAQSS